MQETSVWEERETIVGAPGFDAQQQARRFCSPTPLFCAPWVPCVFVLRAGRVCCMRGACAACGGTLWAVPAYADSLLTRPGASRALGAMFDLFQGPDLVFEGGWALQPPLLFGIRISCIEWLRGCVGVVCLLLDHPFWAIHPGMGRGRHGRQELDERVYEGTWANFLVASTGTWNWDATRAPNARLYCRSLNVI